ncbi:hypothetical protein [Streptomyces sp. NPDC020681]|uniref:hypothetical protein n=1 Tax=Streptomyces sp. NPDC020681 TaxID=3365083 RepID=UPI00378B3454
MHRTSTTATVLVGVAAWAVSGCVAVQPGPVPGPPSQGGRPAQVAEPQIVPDPAREVLEPPPVAPSTSAPAPPPETGKPPATRPHKPRTAADMPPSRQPSPPPVLLPEFRAKVCELAEGYGGWEPDSPQAHTCRKASGS